MPTLIASLALTVSVVLSSALPVQAAQPFGSTGCTGVRPGSWMEAPRGTVYTMGFIFKGVDAKKKTAKYMTTVGHFVFPGFGTKTWSSNAGPQAYDAAGKPIGRFVYAVHADTPQYRSFGLVRLDGRTKPNAQVCHFGGPTGVYSSADIGPRTVQYYGNGFPADQLSPARTAVVTGTPDKESAFGQGVVMALLDTGDAGAPFLADGKALGYWDGGIGAGTGVGDGAGFAIARIGTWVSKAQKALKLKLTLQTARTL